jgi:hypothetical protein
VMSDDASYGSDAAQLSVGLVDAVTRSRGRRTALVVVCMSTLCMVRAPRPGCVVRQCRDETPMRVGESFTASSSPECRKPASEAGRRHRATCAESIATSLCGSLLECGTNPSRSSRPRGDLSRGIDCSGLQLRVTKLRPLSSVGRVPSFPLTTWGVSWGAGGRAPGETLLVPSRPPQSR